jgi:hypothetical protein
VRIRAELLLQSLFVSEEFARILRSLIDAAEHLVDGRGSDAARDRALDEYLAAGVRLNEYLLPWGFYLHLDFDVLAFRSSPRLYAKGYRVDDRLRIPVDTDAARIYVVSGISDAVKPKEELGHRWGESDFAVVFSENVEREVSEVLREMRAATSNAYASARWAVREDQLAALSEFRELVVALYRKDFAGLDEETIRERITDVTAVHEARHVGDRGRSYSYDEEEVRAFQAELASGITPYYSIAFLAKNAFHDGLDDRQTRRAIAEVLLVARNSGLINEDFGDLRLMDFVTLNRMVGTLLSESAISRANLSAIGEALLAARRPGADTTIVR